MCAICGCSGTDHHHAHDHGHTHDPAHDRDHPHTHEHGPAHDRDHGPTHDRSPAHDDGRGRMIRLEQEVLAKNDRIAAECRGWLAGRGVFALNMLSSPGAGKTTLIERTLRDGRDARAARGAHGDLEISVIEGDQETSRDADRIRAAGARVVQINTGTGCHLDAKMVLTALPELDPKPGSVVVIENVGNLVCPALFDLGERAKVVVFSVTEGDDKPLKYPHIFRASDVLVLSKIDLLPHVPFDLERCLANARQVNPRLTVMQVSATRGDGMDDWYAWLRGALPPARARSGDHDHG